MKVKQTIISLISLAIWGFTVYAAFGLRDLYLTAIGFFVAGAFNFVTRASLFTVSFLIGGWFLCGATDRTTLAWGFLALVMAAASHILIQSSSLRKAIQAAGNDRVAVRRATWEHDVSVQIWKLLARRNEHSQQRHHVFKCWSDKMNEQDKRRVLSSVAALLAMPFYFFCGISHFCMDGHMKHPPYPWSDHAIDFVYLMFLSIGLVFAFRSNIPAKKTFIVLTILLLLHVLNELTLVLAIGLIVACIQGLRGSKKTKDVPTDSTVPSDGAPSDAK